MDNIYETTLTNNRKGKKNTFIIPNLRNLMHQHLFKGSQVILPLIKKKDKLSFYESGGRTPKHRSSIATVVAGSNNALPKAMMFNKLARKPNSNQALVVLKQGYSIYVGRISSRNNPLAANVKMFKLVYIGPVDSKDTDNRTHYGEFTVAEIFSGCSEIKDNVPAERLLLKLFTDDVIKPYYVNGWSCTDLTILDIESIKKRITDIWDNVEHIDTETYTEGDKFIDTVENCIVERISEPNRLSASIQFFDFKLGKMYMVPMRNLRLDNISNTISSSKAVQAHCIKMESMLKCYNNELMFTNQDIMSLQMAMSCDSTCTIEVSDSVFAVIRAYRG